MKVLDLGGNAVIGLVTFSSQYLELKYVRNQQCFKIKV